MAATTNESDKYEVLDKIGHGSFGIIHRVKRKTDSKILCRKEIEYVRMSQKEREQLHAEFSILSSLRHPNIVAYYHRDHLKPRQELHLYMEYCGGGDLGKYIKNLKSRKELAPEAYVWSVIAQLVTALYRCHNGEDPPEVGNNVMAQPKNKPTSLQSKSKIVILHRDLKPENVFLGEDDQVKLGDFGLSKLIQSNDFASTYVGTPYYMSPEICAAERYGTHSDIWSLGCIIYELCKQQPPFDARTHYELVQKIKLGRVAPLPDVYSPELQNLIKSCLNVNPQRRPDTWALIQMPVIRLMRKEREVVELGKLLEVQRSQTKQKCDEAEALHVSLDQDKKQCRVELEAILRREWEVKARLEIDRQVAIEKEKLMKQFDEAVEQELQRRLEIELEARLPATEAYSAGTSSPKDAPIPHLSQTSVSTLDSFTGPSTDMSSLSLDSPSTNTSLHSAVLPVRKTRTPGLARAATTNNIVNSPADVHMASPSPMSIASLALSPRRAAALSQGVPTGNLFHQGAAQQTGARSRWQPQLLSPMTSDDEGGPILEESEDEDDGVPELPSPTRMPRPPIADPFKSRPAMKRQRTAPANRMIQPAPPLFSGATGNQPTSPTRIRAPFKKANTAVGGEDMLKAVHARNMRNENSFATAATQGSTASGLSGRTLVELSQGRTGGAAPSTTALPAATTATAISVKVTGEKVGAAMGLEEVARWDPDETPDMPSPFIRRGTRNATAAGR